MTFMMRTGGARRPLPGMLWPVERPAPATEAARLLVMTWQPAPDGRGLVARWSEAPGRWFAPVSFRALRPAPRARRGRWAAASHLRSVPRRAAAREGA